MAKKTSTKKEVNKDADAKKKADELFNDVIVGSKPKSEIKVNLEKESTDKLSKGGNAWLEEQVQLLSEEVEELKEKLVQKTLDYEKLLSDKKIGGSVKPQSESETQKHIKNIFEELRTNYEGLNATRTRYTDAKIKLLLERFLKSFPFLLEGKKAIR